MNTLKEFRQQLKVWHRYLMTIKTPAPTAIAQPLMSIEYNLKFLYLTLISVTAVGHQLWDYFDYDLSREQYSVTHTSLKANNKVLGTVVKKIYKTKCQVPYKLYKCIDV